MYRNRKTYLKSTMRKGNLQRNSLVRDLPDTEHKQSELLPDQHLCVLL